MLLSLVDILRCPQPHEESTLVLSVESWHQQRVWSGALGCPVCHARYDIREGIPSFGDHVPLVRPAGPADAGRLAAQLGLFEPGGVVLLTGRYAAAYPELVEGADVTCLLLDAAPARHHQAINLDGVSSLPLGSHSLRGAALDEGRVDAAFLAEVVRCLRSGARFVAPAEVPVPPGMTLVARDDHECVVELPATMEKVTLVRRQPIIREP